MGFLVIGSPVALPGTSGACDVAGPLGMSLGLIYSVASNVILVAANFVVVPVTFTCGAASGPGLVADSI